MASPIGVKPLDNHIVPPLIHLERVVKKFGTTCVLDDITTEVRKGEVVVVCGPSGSGKSTLVRTINRLEPIDGGLIGLSGQNIYDIQVDNLRRKIGFVFQNFNLFPHMNARDNIAVGLQRVLKWSRAAAEARAEELLKRVGLAHRADRFPATLSGGEQQRVAICRAIAMDPVVLLFDEPTSALDPEMVGEILSLMKALAREGSTMICVTHEIAFAREVADTIWFLHGGKLRDVAAPSEFFTNPRSLEAQRFLSTVRSH